jgi:hypothetical protein
MSPPETITFAAGLIQYADHVDDCVGALKALRQPLNVENIRLPDFHARNDRQLTTAHWITAEHEALMTGPGKPG